MKVALIADIHANAAALSCVATAIEALRPDRVVCLGDLVGYNAEPSEAIAIVQRIAHVVVAGNHDRDVADGTSGTGTRAAAIEAQAWTRRTLGAEDLGYLARLEARWIDPGGFFAVHGCFLNETHVNGYVTSTMLEHNLRALAGRTDRPHVAFCGHTHLPMCGFLSAEGACVEPSPCGTVGWPASARAVLVNPGSVGQPRDGDTRASFAIVDLTARTATFHRLPYPVEQAARAILDAGLPASLADRLREGR
jgi:diadenosine tetraphosphatase ApaH/serine/threonine PP2A family protein phosphatase